jgi:hypothetical protein
MKWAPDWKMPPMTVACFCGAVFQPLHGEPICPECGEPVEIPKK